MSVSVVFGLSIRHTERQKVAAETKRELRVWGMDSSCRLV